MIRDGIVSREGSIETGGGGGCTENVFLTFKEGSVVEKYVIIFRYSRRLALR
jgi:hypothetical protein